MTDNPPTGDGFEFAEGVDPFLNPELVPDPNDPEIRLHEFLTEARAMQEASQAASSALDEVRAVVDNKFLRLDMIAGGTIANLTFNASANAATAQQLTEAFAEAHAQAGAEVTRQTMRIMATIAGEDDPSVALIERSVPDSVADQMAFDEQHPDQINTRKDTDDESTPAPGPEAHGGDDDLGTF